MNNAVLSLMHQNPKHFQESKYLGFLARLCIAVQVRYALPLAFLSVSMIGMVNGVVVGVCIFLGKKILALDRQEKNKLAQKGT